MAGFDNDKLELVTEEKDSEVTDNTVLEEEDQDEFSDNDDLEVNFKPEHNLALDSVEIDVEELLSEIQAEANTADTANVLVRKRLEVMLERKRRREDTIDFDEYDLGG